MGEGKRERRGIGGRKGGEASGERPHFVLEKGLHQFSIFPGAVSRVICCNTLYMYVTCGENTVESVYTHGLDRSYVLLI